MKKIAFYFLLTLSIASFQEVSAQKRTLDLASFNELSFGISGTLYLKQGPQQVVVDCSDDTFDKIEFKVSGNQLIIGSKNNRGWDGIGNSPLTIYITMENIEALGLSGSGELIGEGKMQTGNLKLRVSGSGNMTLETTASDVSAEISGSGKVKLAGSADNLKARISGSGSIKAEDMTTTTVDATISGSGSVYVNVTEEVVARISGSGNVYYTGEPKRKDAQSSGSGKIKKMNG